MSMESDAKEAAILQMMTGYGSSSKISDATIDAYLAAVSNLSVEAVVAACGRFLRGEVEERSHAFMPSAAEVAAQARMLDNVLKRVSVGGDGLVSYRMGELPPPGMEPAGIKSIAIGGRQHDVTGWTLKEQDEAITTGVIPESVVAREAAGLPLKLQRMDS